MYVLALQKDFWWWDRPRRRWWRGAKDTTERATDADWDTLYLYFFFNIYWSLSVKLQVCISLVLFFLRNCFCASKVTFMYVVHCHKHTGDRYPKCSSLLKGKSKSHGQPGKGQNPTKQSKTRKPQTNLKTDLKVVTWNNNSVHILTLTGNIYTSQTGLTQNSWEQW